MHPAMRKLVTPCVDAHSAKAAPNGSSATDRENRPPRAHERTASIRRNSRVSCCLTITVSSSFPNDGMSGRALRAPPWGADRPALRLGRDPWRGPARVMLEGIIRARYRESSTEPKPITPDEAHKDRLDLGPTAYVCEDGHRLRLQVSSSDFPQSDRNTSTSADHLT